MSFFSVELVLTNTVTGSENSLLHFSHLDLTTLATLSV